MLRTKAVEERLRRGRMEAKTRDAMFRAKIEVGAKCAPFVSQVVLNLNCRDELIPVLRG